MFLPDIQQSKIKLINIKNENNFNFLLTYAGFLSEQTICVNLDEESDFITILRVHSGVYLTKNYKPEINIKISKSEAEKIALQFILKNSNEWQNYQYLIIEKDKNNILWENEINVPFQGLIFVHPNGNSPSTRDKYRKKHGISVSYPEYWFFLPELRLAWPVSIKSPNSLSEMSNQIGTIFKYSRNENKTALIYVDAETGEVLGGM
ncbi:MAG: hypothetical protein WC002_03045 [Candidatus Muiribacteriota bacterium]